MSKAKDEQVIGLIGDDGKVVPLEQLSDVELAGVAVDYGVDAEQGREKLLVAVREAILSAQAGEPQGLLQASATEESKAEPVLALVGDETTVVGSNSLEVVSSAAVAGVRVEVEDAPAPTMVNGRYVGPVAEQEPEKNLQQRAADAFHNARQIDVLVEMARRIEELEARLERQP